MFNEQLLIALMTDTGSSASQAGNSQTSLQARIETIQALKSDRRIDIVVVASHNQELLAAAHEQDAVNMPIADFEGDSQPLSNALRQVLASDVQTIEDEAWVLSVDASLEAIACARLVERALVALVSNPQALAVSALETESGKPLLHLIQAATFAQGDGLPEHGTFTFLA